MDTNRQPTVEDVEMPQLEYRKRLRSYAHSDFREANKRARTEWLQEVAAFYAQ